MKGLFTTDAILPEQIADWKTKYKNLFEISVPITDEENSPTISGYFRKPTIDELGLSASGSKENPLKSSIIIYNTCLLGGHPDFENDEDVKMAALQQFGEIVKRKQAQIKKL